MECPHTPLPQVDRTPARRDSVAELRQSSLSLYDRLSSPSGTRASASRVLGIPSLLECERQHPARNNSEGIPLKNIRFLQRRTDHPDRTAGIENQPARS